MSLIPRVFFMDSAAQSVKSSPNHLMEIFDKVPSDFISDRASSTFVRNASDSLPFRKYFAMRRLR